jgi:hypothetical protein
MFVSHWKDVKPTSYRSGFEHISSFLSIESFWSLLQIGVPMTEYMKDIHGAIIQCIEATLSDLKRSNTEV